MMNVGYAWLIDALNLQAVPVVRPAQIAPIQRIVERNDAILFPTHVAPSQNAPVLEHVLFALKHEGTDLAILSQALLHIPAQDLKFELMARPSGKYGRIAAMLWEHFTQQELSTCPASNVPYVDLFDPAMYCTTAPTYHQRWRVRCNGIGTLDHAITVQLTPAIQQLLNMNILDQLDAFIEQVGQEMLDRALSWAYLSETNSSFEIEREKPTQDKAEAFIALLHHAHDRRDLDEDYFVELQNSVLTNPFDLAVEYRAEQNWLQRGGRGPTSVSYVPPAPQDVPGLMSALCDFTIAPPESLDPLIVASIASFWFVFIHPFMDGNGRLSRFLFHYSLCRSGRIAKGFLLPISVAIKRHEADYLAALESFSKPVRSLWRVRSSGEADFDFSTEAGNGPYRYWDATRCVEFGLRMAKEALEVDLQTETQFLAGYDQVREQITEEFDLRSTDLARLIQACHEQQGRISKRWREQLGHRVQPLAFDAIESAVKRVFFPAADQSDGS